METESTLTVYTLMVPGYDLLFCISNASQSDRTESKLECCGLRDWL